MSMNPLTLPTKGKRKGKIEALGSEQLGTLRPGQFQGSQNPQGLFSLRQGPKPTCQFPEGFLPPITPGHTLQISMSSFVVYKHMD